MNMRRFAFTTSIIILIASACFHTPDKPVDRLLYEQQWQSRVQSILEAGNIPIIDLESTLPEADISTYFPDFLDTMDELNIALIAFDGEQVPRTSPSQTGYRWSTYIDDLVEDYPSRFLFTTNGGTNNNWTQQKSSYIDQLSSKIRRKPYVMLGEVEFRHYMSTAQCLAGRTDRDEYVPMNSVNGRRLFDLASDTGVPLSIHFEMEDDLLSELEEMLSEYPNARVIVAHLGQVRHPEKQTRYSAQLITDLLDKYSNLYFDISTGGPNRTYPCNNDILDTVIWQDDGTGGQRDTLKPEYLNLLENYSDRFVAATDYGSNRSSIHNHYAGRIENIELVLRDLSDDAKHNISYKNAWKLITGKEWE